MTATAHSQVKERPKASNTSAIRATAERGVTTTVEFITPDDAARMLEANTRNRPLSTATVSRYAEDMKAGRWDYNGQDILFAEDGVLLDGQHRLKAIIVAEVPVLVGVKRGLPASIFATLDAGKSRTAGDILSLQGFERYNQVASAGRLALSYTVGIGLRPNPATTRRAVTDFVLAHPYLTEATKIVAPVHGRLNISPTAAVVFLANERRFFDQQIVEFIEGVGTGEGLDKGDPRLTLREWAVNERLRNRGQLPSEAVFTAVARAWTAYARGEDLKLIKIARKANRETVEIVGFYAPSN